MIYGYVRVSTNMQETSNQRFEIKRFCEANNMQVDKWFDDEGISGTVDYKKRKIGNILRRVKKGDTIIVCELSRLGRELFMIMEILHRCMEKGVNVWTIKEGYRMGGDIQSKVLAFAFSLSAEIERNLISQRTKEALARKKSEGVKLGRPKGKMPVKKYKLHSKRKEIKDLVEQGYSMGKIANMLDTNRKTVTRYCDRIGIERKIYER